MIVPRVIRTGIFRILRIGVEIADFEKLLPSPPTTSLGH
jgi:hypothetical protein